MTHTNGRQLDYKRNYVKELMYQNTITNGRSYKYDCLTEYILASRLRQCGVILLSTKRSRVRQCGVILLSTKGQG
jgi:hypothetical protein